MENKNAKVKIQKGKIFYGLEKIAKVNQKIYQKRESEDSQRNFEFKRAGKVNSTTLSKIFKTI